MTPKTRKDWTSPDGSWRWNSRKWTPGPPRKLSLLARVMVLPPIRRSLLRSALIAALMVLTLTVAVACGSRAGPTPAVAAATSATPTAEPTTTPTPEPTATPTAPPTAAPAPASAVAVPAPAPRVAAQAPAPPPVAQPPAADPYAAATAAGASAVCADGSWSFSKNRSGTCSHHGASIGGLETSGRQGRAGTKPRHGPRTGEYSCALALADPSGTVRQQFPMRRLPARSVSQSTRGITKTRNARRRLAAGHAGAWAAISCA